MKQKFVSPVLMWMIFLIGFASIFFTISSKLLFQNNILTNSLAVFLIIYWIFMFAWSLISHKQAPQSTLKIKKLIKEGPYKFVRHPIYSADIILGTGIFLLFPSQRIFASLIWLIIVLVFWMKLEEKSLVNKFGVEYKSYMKKTPMLIPKMKGGQNEKI